MCSLRQGPARAAPFACFIVVLAGCRLGLNGTGSIFTDDGGAGVDGGVDDAPGDGRGDDTLDDDTGASLVVAPPELAWYPLSETTGTTAHDATANHYDVTDLAGVTWGSGASFDGTGGGGSTPVDPGLRQAPVSFTAWLAPDSRIDEAANSYGLLPFPSSAVSGDAPGQFGFGIGLDVWSGASALAVEDVGNDFHNAGGAEFVVATEYFVAAAIGATTATVYVDGQQVGQATPGTPGATAVTTLALGFHNEDPGYGTRRFYAGRMRDVRVYKRVLTASEVVRLHVAGPATGP